MASVNELTIRMITHGVREGVKIEDVVQVFSLVSLEPISFFRIGFIKYKKKLEEKKEPRLTWTNENLCLCSKHGNNNSTYYIT